MKSNEANMKNLYKVFVILSVFFSVTNVFAQAASVTWPLNNPTQLTSVNSGNVIGSAESISVGSGQFGMSVFDYSTDGQRLWEGTAGWIAGTEESTRFIQFDALPASGNSFTVTNVSFNYGAAGIDNNIKSNVYYSTDGWVTRTLLNPSPLAYPGFGMTPFTKDISVTIASGSIFSVRIYPYSILNSSPVRPTFAVHNNVVISGSTAAKKNCVIQVTDAACKWGKSVLLTARLQEIGAAGNTNLPNQELLFKVSMGTRESDTVDNPIRYDVSNAGTTQYNGVASISYTIPQDSVASSIVAPQDSVARSIRVEFAGDANYYAQSGTGLLTVVRHVASLAVAPTTSVYGQPVVFTATLTDNDNDGKGVSNQELKFYKISLGTREGDTARVYIGSGKTNANGVASISYTLPQDSVISSISVSYMGDANYSPKSGTGKFTNTLKTSILQITNVAGKWGKQILLGGTLQVLGTPSNTNMPNKALQFYIDDIIVGKATTNESGVASLAYTIPQDSVTGSISVPQDSVAHTIKAVFTGDANYNAQSGTGTLKVLRHVTSLTVAPTIYIRGAQPVIVHATLTDNDENGKGVSNKKLNFYKISPGTREGDTARVYIGSSTTNSSGIASFSSIWDDTDIVHSISVTFEFDNDYDSQTGRGIFTYTSTVVENNHVDIPTKFDLLQNYPNPFNPTSTIRYDIPKTGFVNISVYDILGREVKVLVNEEKNAGHFEIIFDAKNLASGIYFYAIRAAGFTQSKKMILMK